MHESCIGGSCIVYSALVQPEISFWVFFLVVSVKEEPVTQF